MSHFEALFEWVAAQDELRAAQQQWVKDHHSGSLFESGGLKTDPRQTAAVARLQAAEANARAVLDRPFVSQTAAVRDVLAERSRQINVEGFTSHHDDNEHDAGEIASAASAYALAAADQLHPLSQGDGDYKSKPPPMWPWDASWWKHSEPRRMLVKSAALALAEIERIDRAEAPKPKVFARGGFVGDVMTRSDGWISEDGGMSWRDPAPNAANPAMPRSPIVTVTIGAPSASSTVDPSGVLKTPARGPHRGGYSYEASMLRNLLARIHGDGGHCVEKHGLEKALEDADAMVATWRATSPDDGPVRLSVILRDGDIEACCLDALSQVLNHFGDELGLKQDRIEQIVSFMSVRWGGLANG